MKRILLLVCILIPGIVFAAQTLCNTNSADLGASNTNKSLSIANNLGVTGGAITEQFWVKLYANPSSGNAYFFVQQADAGVDVTYQVQYQNNGGTMQLFAQRCRTGVICATLSYNVDLGTTWHQITLTYDTTNVNLYLDGTLVAGPIAASGNGSGNSNEFIIGRNDGGAAFYSGLIDDVRVFNVARSAASITADYSSPGELSPPVSNLVAYYTMDVAVTTDSSGSGFTLTNTNSVTQSTTVPFAGQCGSFNFWQFFDF